MKVLDGMLRKGLYARMERLARGRLTIEANGASASFGDGDGPEAAIRVRDPRFFREVVLGGSVGAAESFMDGAWECDDLTALVRVLVRNREVLDGLETGWARLAAPARAALHALRRNTRRGSRRNIAAHYDLGNEFFALFLDPGLTYSCALFERPGQPLEEAQAAKYERLCLRTALGPDARVVETGTGWGGFALHAGGRHGCRVTTTTISAEQHALASRRVAEAGLASRVELLRRDYRDLEGRFDAVVSIEMIEAVGHAYHDAYFAKCAALLRPGGRMGLQAIVIGDDHYDRARREVDFIKRYIFPGSCIPSIGVLTASAARAGLAVEDVHDLTPDYAETLRQWAANFRRNRERVRALGFPPSFCRMWEFYFSYCEGGFAERYIGDVQMVLSR